MVKNITFTEDFTLNNVKYKQGDSIKVYNLLYNELVEEKRVAVLKQEEETTKKSKKKGN